MPSVPTRAHALLLLVLLAACAPPAPGPAAADATTDPADVPAADAKPDTAKDTAPDTGADVAPEVTADAPATPDAEPDAALDTGPAHCAQAGCPAGDTCRTDGTCCTPECSAACGGMPDGCGGQCSEECAGVCTVPTAAPATVYRAFAFKPLATAPAGMGCPLALGGGGDGTAITDFADSPGFAQGNTTAIAFATEDGKSIAKTGTWGLLAGTASGSGCAAGQEGCTLALWAASFNPHGLPGPCPARAELIKDKTAADPTFKQVADSPVPAFAPLFLFAGPVEQVAPWVRVQRLVATPSTTTAGSGVFCGAVRVTDLQAAIGKLSASQQAHPSVAQVTAWLQDHEPGVDTDGNGDGDAHPFAFSLGVAKAGPASVKK